MTIYFEEFDTTVANVMSDLVSKITSHADWSDIFAITTTSNTTASTSNSSTTLTVASTAAWNIGDPIKIVGGTTGTTYYRYITGITSGTAMTMNQSFGVSETTGSVISYHSNILKATTSSGAQVIVELARDSSSHRLMLRTYATHDGTTGTGMGSWRQVQFHNSSAVAGSSVVHGILSLSEDHLFVSLEGPRPNEINTTSTTYGSVRQYFVAGEITRYRDDDDTPCIFFWANPYGTTPSYLSRSFLGEVSRNYADTQGAVRARLVTMTVPIFNTNSASAMNTTFQSKSAIDGKMFLWPYLVVEDVDGLRGRLKMFHYVGNNRGALGEDPLVNPDELVTMGGVVYKTLAPGKSDGSNPGAGPFGWFQPGSTHDSIFGSPIIAVPYADA